MAKTKPDPWSNLDHHCHNMEKSLNNKRESNFTCLQGLSAFFVHDRGNSSKDLHSAYPTGMASFHAQLGQW